MNLLEVANELDIVKHTPEQELEHLEMRKKALDYELRIIRDRREEMIQKIAGKLKPASWGEKNPAIPEEKEKIDAIAAQGYYPLMSYHTWNGREEVEMFIPNLPQNKDLIGKIQHATTRLNSLEKKIHDIPTLTKRAKGRLSAWKRKQPNYVARATGKELLKEIREKIETFVKNFQFPVDIGNNYYWAKNKMIVVEINVRTPLNGMTINNTAKKIKTDLTKYLEELGYTQFRCTERFVVSNLSIIKLQLDDVEAKNKAGESPTTHPPEDNAGG